MAILLPLRKKRGNVNRKIGDNLALRESEDYDQTKNNDSPAFRESEDIDQTKTWGSSSPYELRRNGAKKLATVLPFEKGRNGQRNN